LGVKIGWSTTLDRRLVVLAASLKSPVELLYATEKMLHGYRVERRAPTGIERQFWSNASPIRGIFRKAFDRAGLPYFPPHSFRHTLGHLAQTMCRTPEELKAWSQNLGHENIATTLTSYGKIDPHRQGEVIGQMKAGKAVEADMLAEIGAVIARSRGATSG